MIALARKIKKTTVWILFENIFLFTSYSGIIKFANFEGTQEGVHKIHTIE